MMIQTKPGIPLENAFLCNYFDTLIDMFFKILPIWENGEKSLPLYMRGLQAELLGCSELITALHGDARFITLLSILEYLIDHPETEKRDVKRYVFRAISVCNKLKSYYAVIDELEVKV